MPDPREILDEACRHLQRLMALEYVRCSDEIKRCQAKGNMRQAHRLYIRASDVGRVQVMLDKIERWEEEDA